MTLVFLTATAVTKFQGNSLVEGIKYTRVGKNCDFSTEVAVYLCNGTQ